MNVQPNALALGATCSFGGSSAVTVFVVCTFAVLFVCNIVVRVALEAVIGCRGAARRMAALAMLMSRSMISARKETDRRSSPQCAPDWHPGTW